MFFRLLESKKGYTFVEVMIVVLILGVLTAFAVPAFVTGYKAQAIKDCRNQRVIIEAHVKEALTGMIDNGAAQYKSGTNDLWIDFSKVQGDHKAIYTADDVTGNADDSYNGKECFVIIESQAIPGKIAFTLGDLRGGYRPDGNDEYNKGCAQGYYLKKKKYKDTPFYIWFANQEIPVCPFNDPDNGENYYYYIFEDGSVLCSCPECHENN